MKQDLVRAKQKGSELLEEAGAARRTLKNAEEIREQEVQETKCKQDWYEHRVSALAAQRARAQCSARSRSRRRRGRTVHWPSHAAYL
mgnify:CR=1 FL=1